ncbi:hypothetical protein AGMMS50276_05700 [Synergistales bacterium]|nr:hypothetical protein AGMMS50276_05700 [Synergistales bacterium]
MSKTERFDYDGFWKELILRFFYSLLNRTLPELYADADTTKPPRPMDKEFTDLLSTSKPGVRKSPHFADYLLEVPLKSGDTACVLLHIEIQGRSGGNIAARMYHYNCLIYAHYKKNPVALAIVTDKRPAKEKRFYKSALYGTNTLYEYRTVALLELDNDELLSSDNPIDIVLYAAKSAYYCKEELQKFHYLKEISDILDKRGWSRDDKRDLLLFVDWIVNIKDEYLVKQFREYRARKEEARGDMKITHITALGRSFINDGINEEKRNVAQKMLARQMPIDDIVDLTELSKDEIQALVTQS